MDLFGDIDDISSESDEDNRPPLPGQPVDEHRAPQDQKEKAPISETRIQVEIPSVGADLGNELYFVKLPKFLSIEPKPFEPRLYEDEFEDEKMLYEEDRTRLKLKVENTIRWRVRRDEEGNKIKESNARIVKWSDGSMSLHLGKEVFDVYKAPLQDNHNQLFIREDTGLLGQAIFRSRLTFRPHSTDSATHRKMTLPRVDRSSKSQKIRILPMVGCDPECQRTEVLKVMVAAECTASTPRPGTSERGALRRFTLGRPSGRADDEGKQRLRAPDQGLGGDDAEEEREAACLAASRVPGPGALCEEPARIYSSDSDEGSEFEVPRSLKAKKLARDKEMNLPEREKQGVKRKKMI